MPSGLVYLVSLKHFLRTLTDFYILKLKIRFSSSLVIYENDYKILSLSPSLPIGRNLKGFLVHF